MADLSQQLVERISQAYQANTPLQIEGGATKQDLGRTPVGEHISLQAHHGVIDYWPMELVIRVRSGTAIGEINDLLQSQGQRLAFEPPDYSGKASIGGTIAANQSGCATPWYGGVRDSVLGLGLINGKGEPLQFGGQVMKNVAGFDVSRMQVGAMGTLGVITDVSLKVLPAFQAEQTLIQPMDVAEAIKYMPKFIRENLPVTGVCYWQGVLYVRLQGIEAGVIAAYKRLKGDPLEEGKATQFWQAVREQSLLQPSNMQILWRANVAANDSDVLVHENTLFNWAGAQRWQLLDKGTSVPNSALQYRGGSRDSDVNGSMDEARQALQKKIKYAFDPRAILNPGRLYGWM